MPHHHLTSNERYCIAHQYMDMVPIRQITRHLNRAANPISRKVRRAKGSISPYWYDSEYLPG